MDCSARRPTVTFMYASCRDCSASLNTGMHDWLHLIAIVVATAQHGGLQSAMQRLFDSPGPRTKCTGHIMQAAAHDWHCSSPSC